MTSTSLSLQIANETGYSPAKLQLIKDTIARGATDDELALFLYTAQRAGLDPLARQIYAVKRWDNTLKREAMSVQVGIDGLRLIADRTGRYAPGRAPSFEYDKNGKLLAATSYVMKYVMGTWHEVAATAHYDEYVQVTRDGSPTRMWDTKPRIMLSKCAEALALRRAFPTELSGIYAPEEMGDEEQSRPAPPTLPVVVDTATGEIVEAPVTSRAALPGRSRAALEAEWVALVDKAVSLGISLHNADIAGKSDATVIKWTDALRVKVQEAESAAETQEPQPA